MSSLQLSGYCYVGFYIEHQSTETVITQKPFRRFRKQKAVITAGVILETLSEGVGARLWLFYGATGIISLVIGSAIEHSIQYVVGRIPVESQVVERESA